MNNSVAKTLAEIPEEKLDEIFCIMKRYRHEQTVENILASIDAWGDVDHIRNDVFTNKFNIYFVRDLVQAGLDETTAYEFGGRTCIRYYARPNVSYFHDNIYYAILINDLIDCGIDKAIADSIVHHINIFDYISVKR